MSKHFVTPFLLVVALVSCVKRPDLSTGHSRVAGIEPAIRAVFADGASLPDLLAMDALTRADYVYERVYGRDSPKQGAMITQAQHEVALAGYERKMSVDSWHVRVGTAGQAGENAARRFYLDLTPDGAAVFADALCAELNGKQIPFTVKVPRSLADYDRSSSGVLYVPLAHYPVAKLAVLAIAKEHGRFVGPVTPAFTKRLAPGIGAAHEPDPALPAPKTRPKHSFGSLRSDALAEALGGASPTATQEELAVRARESLARYGIDPARPWLNRTSDADDL